jgi:cysteine sulfinate desulfinase/cysteine desulfurase-like protein
MGLPRELAFAALRVSFSRYSSCEEVAAFLNALQKVLKCY